LSEQKKLQQRAKQLESDLETAKEHILRCLEETADFKRLAFEAESGSKEQELKMRKESESLKMTSS